MNPERRSPTPEIPDHELETIKELGLTNSEWMRYRLTHELPERAGALIKQRFKDQTTARPRSPKTSETKRPAAIAFENKRPHLLKAMDLMIELSETSVDWDRLVQETINFQEGIKGSYIEAMRDKEFSSQINIKMKILFDRILKKIGGPRVPVEDRAKGFVALSHLLERAFDNHELYSVMAGKLREYIDKKDFDLLAILLAEESGISNMAFYELFKAHEKPVEAHYHSDIKGIDIDIRLEKSLLASIAVPLTIHIQKTIANQGLEIVTSETKYLDWLIEKLQIPSVLQELETKGFDLKKVADNYINALLQRYGEIGGGYPSHYQTGKIIKLIENLYAPINGERLPVTNDVIKIVKKLYDAKIVPYRTRTEQKSWAYHVSNKLGLTPNVIDPNFNKWT